MGIQEDYDGGGTTGFPSPASGSTEPTVNLAAVLDLRRPSRYPMRVAGSSLNGRGILEGDILVVDTAVQLHDGCIAVLALGGEMRMEPVELRAGRWWTAGAEPCLLEDVQVWGVATGLVRQVP